MKDFARLALLSAVALAGCNLTYDREGVKFDPPSVASCSASGLDFCTLGTRDFCADLTSDTLNCGGCGNLCGIGVGCTGGVCNGGGVCGAPGTGSQVCGTVENPFCTCGLCTAGVTSCPAGEACVAGSCQPAAVTCTAPEIACPDVGAGPYCANLATDPLDCGACGNACGGTVTCTDSLCGGLLPAVEPFMSSGANWNDWIQGSDVEHAVDAPCNPDVTGPCLHGGELRRVRVTNRTSCTGLTAVDQLGAFVWTCTMGTDGHPWMVSLGLRGAVSKTSPEARLATLVNPTTTLSWIPNRVTVYEGATKLADTPLTVWWTNPIQVVPGSGSLSSPGTVYLLSGGSTPGAIQVTASKVALAILPGVKLGVPAGTTLVAVLISGSTFPRDFLWVEGAIDATNAAVGLQASGVRRSTFRSIDVTRAAPNVAPSSYGLQFVGGDSNRVGLIHAAGHEVGIRFDSTVKYDVRDVEASACSDGIQLNASAVYNAIHGAAVAVNRNDGLVVNSSPDNLLEGVVASNNAGVGVRVMTSQRTRIVDSVAVTNALDGILIESSPDARVVAVTTEGNVGAGVRFVNASNNPVVLGLMAHLDGVGLSFTGTGGGHVADAAVEVAPGLAALQSDAVSSNTFLGTLLIGGPTIPTCSPGSTSAGFTSACGPSGGSTFTPLTSPLGFAGSFVPLPTSDTLNASFTGAAANVVDLDADFDWTSFQNGYRAWGAAPGGTRIGCTTDPSIRTSTGCAGWWAPATIHDWSLQLADAVLRDQLPVPVAGNVLIHPWWTGSASTFLTRAYELSGYPGGNGDGLCETNETCLYAPNYGAYQGHGALVFVGNINASAVGPAYVYRHDPATNGY